MSFRWIVEQKIEAMKTKPLVLIVDDNKAFCDGLKDALEDDGYIVETANNGEDAISLSQSNRYDIALVDYKLPDISGTELVDSLADVSPSMDYIYVTAHATLESAIQAMKQERVISFELKPLDMDHLLSVLNQVVKRRKAEEEIQKLSHALEFSPTTIVITDTEGNIEYVNPKFTQLTGYTFEEAIGQNPRILKTCKTSPEEYECLWKTITSGREWCGEFCNKKKNGELYWESVSISPIKNSEGAISHFIAVKEDITVRKQMEDELRMLNESLEQRVVERTEELREEILEHKKKKEELKNYEILFDNISDLAYICDTQGNILFLNKVFEKLSGHKFEEFMGKSFTPLFSGEDMKKAMDLYSRTLKGESPQGEIRFKDTGVLCEYKNLPLRNEKGEIIGVIGIARDITDRKKTEEQVKASLKEKEELLYEIHHRVKNNLQVISSLLDMSSMQTQNQETIKLFEESRSRVESIALIHSQLYESEQLNKINMERHIQQLSGNLLNIYSKEKTITLDIKSSNVYLPVTKAVPCALVLNELVSNSLKHAYSDGQQGIISISMQQSCDGTTRLKIKDDGVGIPEDIDIELTKSLGLRLVRNIVYKQLNGTMRVARDRGTEFTVEFKHSKEDS